MEEMGSGLICRLVLWAVACEMDYIEGAAEYRGVPGLWLDPEALLALDSKRLLAAPAQGTATDEHAAFAQQLADLR